MEPQYIKPSSSSSSSRPHHNNNNQPMKITIQPSQLSDNDRSSSELRAVDCNLTSLCDHIQMEGFNSGSFSDVIVHAMTSTYHLHRLILSRSSYFRNMLHGPWKEANSPVVTLHIDDKNVNSEAIAIALAYLYGHHPKLNDDNAFRVLAAASFLDLQDLCAICTDFIISELWTSNFLAYQTFAENQDYGIHGERVRTACWGYLCQTGATELKEVLPKLSPQTLHALLTSDELWVPSEEKRFELALYTLFAKGALCVTENSEQARFGSEMSASIQSDSSKAKGKNIIDSSSHQRMESELGHLSLSDDHNTAHNLLVDLDDREVGFRAGVTDSNQDVQQNVYNQASNVRMYPCNMDQPSMAMEGPSEEGSCYQLNNNSWLASDQRQCSSIDSSCDTLMLSDWGRCGVPPLSWGGRVVGRRQLKGNAEGNCGVREDEYDAFVNVFEGGSLLYCNMSFESMLNVRKQLEELGFPCKAVNDGLWLQMLLSQRVQEIGADTCKNCCHTSIACSCRQPIGISNGVSAAGYFAQEHPNNLPSGNVYVAESAQGEANGLFRPVRVHVRGAIDGLAGIGRGNTLVPTGAWPPTRFVFSRVPFGTGNRNGQQAPANDDSETRTEHNGDLAGDGLTALVGLSQGGSYETDPQSRFNGSGPSITGTSTSGIAVQMLDSPELGIEWENPNSSSISLDMKTPLNHFPPFRFGIEFEDVHRLSDGLVKRSPEFFYAGSLWMVSVQAFNDEDPQGRRTLGLFLHRRKAEITDPIRKVHMYVDTREKVTARYQLICPSKREVMVLGSVKQRGTLLPKAPKGWGWRTALLFDELADLLQNGSLRVAAVVQLV
ncbi:hypothetical protein ACFE04_005351 [Oxalis oulophora]